MVENGGVRSGKMVEKDGGVERSKMVENRGERLCSMVG